MRIISGKFRATKLTQIDTDEIKPTADRLKETIFNVLQHNYPDSLRGIVWDLFAGSAALSLEAISRGAKSALVIDNNITYATKNKEKLKLANQVRIIRDNVLGFHFPDEKPSLVFIDPPYKSFNLIPETLQRIFPKISQETIVVVETDSTQNLENIKNYKIIDTRKTRNSIAWFLQANTQAT